VEMPRGTQLSLVERTQIESLRGKWVLNKRSGRKRILADRDKRSIKRLAITNNFSCTQIKSELGLNVTKRRINQILNEDLDLDWLSLKNNNIIFSDEKKFNLDGPDGFKYYWREKGGDTRTRIARNSQGGFLMIWVAFGYRARSPICFISHKMNAENYVELLDNVFVEFAEENYGNNFIFQQDNAPIYVAKRTKAFFEEKDIAVLDWPPLSPDLNPAENLWGILSAEIYKSGMIYKSIKELKETLIKKWDKIPQNELQKLINSMPLRLNEVIKNRGGHTYY
ncbi:hypothetical protein DOY81_006040, partial [Sarcophaga bullata]